MVSCREPEEKALNIVDKIWQFFVSIKLTVILLLSLAATSVIGTLVPQNESPEAYFRAYGAFLYRLFEVLDIFNMYHSWWFRLLVALLMANILVCSIDRLTRTWKLIFPSQLKVNRARFKKQTHYIQFTDKRPADTLEPLCQEIASRQFSKVVAESTDNGFHVFAEKHRWTRLGVYVVHTSVLFLLIGALVGSLFGFDGYVNVPEGESVNHIRLRNTGKVMPLEFSIRCNDFNVSFYPTGQPKEYRSSLSLIKDGKILYEKDIIVNDPLRFAGINIFQSSYGQLAPESAPLDLPPPQSIVLSAKSTRTGMVYRLKGTMNQEIKLPEDAGHLILTQYRPDSQFMGRSLGESLTGVLKPSTGDPVDLTLPLRFPNFDKMRKGTMEISIAEVDGQTPQSRNLPQSEPRFYTGLQVTKDPGVWIVYAGFILMITGCFVTFFMSHQQLFIEVNRNAKGSRIFITGISNRNKISMRSTVAKIAVRLGHRSTGGEDGTNAA